MNNIFRKRVEYEVERRMEEECRKKAFYELQDKVGALEYRVACLERALHVNDRPATDCGSMEKCNG